MQVLIVYITIQCVHIGISIKFLLCLLNLMSHYNINFTYHSLKDDFYIFGLFLFLHIVLYIQITFKISIIYFHDIKPQLIWIFQHSLILSSTDWWYKFIMNKWRVIVKFNFLSYCSLEKNVFLPFKAVKHDDSKCHTIQVLLKR